MHIHEMTKGLLSSTEQRGFLSQQRDGRLSDLIKFPETEGFTNKGREEISGKE